MGADGQGPGRAWGGRRLIGPSPGRSLTGRTPGAAGRRSPAHAHCRSAGQSTSRPGPGTRQHPHRPARVGRTRPGAARRSRARRRSGSRCRPAGDRRWSRRPGGRGPASRRRRRQVARPAAQGRSPWATVTCSTPMAARRATPASTAPLRPRPGSQTTRRPCWRAQSATSLSSQTTATGRGAAAATHLLGHPAAPAPGDRRRRQRRAEPPLGVGEGLDRDQHRLAPEQEAEPPGARPSRPPARAAVPTSPAQCTVPPPAGARSAAMAAGPVVDTAPAP